MYAIEASTVIHVILVDSGVMILTNVSVCLIPILVEWCGAMRVWVGELVVYLK